MRIGGFQKVSLIDYPGKICAIVFTQGCNFRCSYCHNPQLVKPELYTSPIPEEEILSHLTKRKGKLDGVEVTGGEPLIQPDLPDLLTRIKKLGYLIKLDTNGSFPFYLKEILDSRLIDYIAMDIKAPLAKYSEVVGVEIEKEKILESIKLIMKSDLDYEFRTTILKSQLSKEDVIDIGRLITGAHLYVLQKAVLSSNMLEGKFKESDLYNNDELDSLREILEDYVRCCIVR